MEQLLCDFPTFCLRLRHDIHEIRVPGLVEAVQGLVSVGYKIENAETYLLTLELPNV